MEETERKQIERILNETKNKKIELVYVKGAPIKKEIDVFDQQWKGGFQTKGIHSKGEPITMSGEKESVPSQDRYEVDFDPSMLLQPDGPALTQMDISLVLNNSDYEDDSTEEDSKLREHETDCSSSDDEDKGTEEASHLWMGHAFMGGHNAVKDVDHLENKVNRTRYSQESKNWHRTRFVKTKPNLHQPAYIPNKCSSSEDVLEYFNEYFDDSLFDTIVRNTNQTSIHNGKPLNFTRAECKTFFGIIITMSCINYPNIRMYWNRKWAIDLIVKAMTRDRFMTLRQSLKLVFDDDITTEMRAADHLWKVRPMINRVLEGCHRQERNQNIAINEMTIPLKGTYPMKQYCPNKPNPTGIKIVALLNPNGMICDFVTYQGKHNLVEEIVLHLTRTLVPGHILYFNKYFTTIELAKMLNQNGFKCAGAIMKSRLPAEVKSELISDQLLSKKQGSHDVLVSSDGELAITKWINNKPSFFLSTLFAAETLGIHKRYNRKKSRTVSIPRPEVVKEYNTNMAGIGFTERLLAACHSKTRMSKWTLRFMIHFLNLAVCNSWIKYKKEMQERSVAVHKTYQLWEFKRLIGEQLIESCFNADSDVTPEDEESYSAHRRGRRPLAPIPSKMKRVRGNEHLPEVGVVQRCKNTGCEMKTSFSCMTCNLNLCLTRKRNCFKQFHTDGSC